MKLLLILALLILAGCATRHVDKSQLVVCHELGGVLMDEVCWEMEGE